jgi:general secretion pathway protein I
VAFEDGGEMAVFQQPQRGFTLLEVMVALAIMASVVLTVLGAVNYHLTIIANERDSTALTLLARAKMAELVQLKSQGQALSEKSEGTLAPAHPELSWQAELTATDLTALQKLVVRVWRTGEKREVVLERYLTK